jgi:hypothetical protein
VDEVPVLADKAGVVIGRTELPLVNEGDALFHLAVFDAPAHVASAVGDFQDALEERLPDDS